MNKSSANLNSKSYFKMSGFLLLLFVVVVVLVVVFDLAKMKSTNMVFLLQILKYIKFSETIKLSQLQSLI